MHTTIVALRLATCLDRLVIIVDGVAGQSADMGHSILRGITAFCLLLVPITLRAAEPARPPNFVIVFVDDMGYGSPGVLRRQGRSHAGRRRRAQA